MSRGTLIAFWTKTLENLPVLSLPLDRPRSRVHSFVRSKETLVVPDALEAAESSGASLFELLCSAVAALLFRYTGQSDVVLGSVSTDDEEASAKVVPLRIAISGQQKCWELIDAIAIVIAEAARYRDIDYDELIESLGIDDDDTRGPVFQSMCVLQGEPHSLSKSPVTEDDLVDLGEHLARLDLIFVARRDGRSLIIECDYDTDILEAATVKQLATHLGKLFHAVSSRPQEAVSRLPILDEDERRRILHGWNDTRVDYPTDETLVSLFESQVERSPEAVALIFGEQELTYAQFNRRANQLAHHLRELGVGPEVVVGVFMERSVEMVVALYAIIKAGGAYLPVDPEYPAERIAFMLEDAAAAVLLTQEHLIPSLPKRSATVVSTDDGANFASSPETNLASAVSADDLAYIIYTSGSTGRPKGVMNTHRGIVNRPRWMQDAFRLDDHDRVVQKTPFSFDVSVWEFFWPLQVGARLVVARPGGHRDTAYLADFIRTHGITTIHFVPSMLQLAIEEPGVETCTSLKRVICSGEALPYELQERFFQRMDAELHNLYGPTEAAVDVTHWPCERGSSLRIVPIGRPVANTQIYVLDRFLEPVPARVAGELHIGGVQVARGYVNRSELTEERFIPDPFSDDPKARLYKTGDLARMLPNGSVEYLGRIDHQVKLRGFRIELGEIETALSEQENVRESVVVVREDAPGDKKLVAYVVSRDNETLSIGELKAQLKKRLPDFMIPSATVQLEAMPLSPNGKVDRSALPAPSVESFGSAEFVAPLTEAEQLIAAMWQDVLGRGDVGLRDNFFDLGGHSLLVAQCRNRIKDLFGIEMTMTELFRFPTVALLAEHIRECVRGKDAQESGSASVFVANRHVARDVAIVGMACRLPGAKDVQAFWRNLEAGVESVSFFEDAELIDAGVPESVLESPSYVKARAILGEVDRFDAAFFAYSPREAELMDPQQRLFLECAWESLEASGYDPSSMSVPVGVFAASGMNTYVLKYLHPAGGEVSAVGEFQRMIANDKDFLATRVSYKLNLKGPAINVQTACSSSLVAVHMACRSLLWGECDMVLAGGTSISLPEKEGYVYQDGMILSPDGHCRAFDASAAGTVFGNGVSVVVLKCLDDAIASGDHIHAVIKGSAVNNDGSLKIGYTAPSVAGQSEVIARAQAEAGVDPRSIGYVETHGTGTALGDPIEVGSPDPGVSTGDRRHRFLRHWIRQNQHRARGRGSRGDGSNQGDAGPRKQAPAAESSL